METKTCEVGGCKNINYEKYVKGYCRRHNLQLRQCGKILERTRFDKNNIIDCDNYCEIVLYSGRSEQKEIARAKIDKEDLDKINKYKWCLVNKGKKRYVINVKNKLYLHHLIIGKPINKYEVDHIDTDGLNNRKQNLRIITHQQNGMNRGKNKNNTSGFVGILWEKRKSKWRSNIKIDKKDIFLGYFTNKQDAINARKKAEQKYFGEFAYQGES